MPISGRAGSKWRLRAKPEQPQIIPPACLASGTSGFAGFGLFLNQPMLNCLNSPRAPTKATGNLQTCLVARPSLSPWYGQPQPLPGPSCLVLVGAVGLSRPGAGPTAFHKCLIPAQSRSSATHKHLRLSSHPGLPQPQGSSFPLCNRLRRKGAGGDPTEPPPGCSPRPPLCPQHGGCRDHPTHLCLG